MTGRAIPTAPEPGGADARLSQLRGSLAAARERLRGLIAEIPDDDSLEGLTISVLDDCFDELKKLEGAGAVLKARLVACASAARVHQRTGMTDTGAYLRDRLGVSGREAKRQTELSNALTSMDGAADAVADGRLGIEQAGVLGRAARNGHLGGSDEVERELLEAATSSSPEELQRTVRKREHEADADALRRDENRAYALRRASISKQPGDMWSLRAELDPVNGELLATAIRAFTTPDDPNTSPDQRRTTDKRTADGLVQMACHALQTGAPQAGGIRPHISVVVMADQPDEPGANVNDERLPHSLGVTGAGTVLSPQATARLICDSALSRVVMSGPSQVLDLGRTTRAWSGPQRRGIIARDGTCRGFGCDRPPDWCDVHHIRWWQHGGPTDLDNGILLCRHHHRLIHEGGWSLTLEHNTGRAVFTDPRGKEQTTLPRGAPVLLA